MKELLEKMTELCSKQNIHTVTLFVDEVDFKSVIKLDYSKKEVDWVGHSSVNNNVSEGNAVSIKYGGVIYQFVETK